MVLQPHHVPESPGRDASWAARSAITLAPPRAPGPASPAGGLVVRQLQQLRGGVGQVPLPAALQLCHILSGLVMDLNGLSRRSYPDRDPLTYRPPRSQSHTLPHTVSLPAARTRALERLKGNHSTEEHPVLNPLAPRQDIAFSEQGLSSCEASA